eukprot:TRINITY_DN3654_c0_g1_i3.p1 TRINITY_DN3654_c0_g1~~TRINITY_DN3654_c0_g1_i3.p1  ORF type:complete len:175 (+),score=32.90 TRINITY_DN3654_c0_g1_i3:90-614(+)
MDEQIAALRSLLEETEDLPELPFEIDDQLLRRFIWTKKTPERAYPGLVRYVKFLANDLSKIVEFEFEDIVPCLEPTIPFDGVYRDKNGVGMSFGRSQGFLPSKYGIDRLLIGMFICIEYATQMFCLCFLLMVRPEEQENGIHFVYNMTGFGWSNFHKDFTKKLLKLMTVCCCAV